jgi:hypothetical protein
LSSGGRSAFLGGSGCHPVFCHFTPAEIVEHHSSGKNERAGIDHILICIFGSGTMGCFKYRVTGNIVDITAGSDADPAHLRRKGQEKRLEAQRGSAEQMGALIWSKASAASNSPKI